MPYVNLIKTLSESKEKKHCQKLNNMYSNYCVIEKTDKLYCKHIKKLLSRCDKIDFKSVNFNQLR